MLNKFQDQYLLANVEKLEDIKKVMMRHFKQVNICLKIDKVISDMKSINPLLFSYPKVARYLSGKYDPTITE